MSADPPKKPRNPMAIPSKKRKAGKHIGKQVKKIKKQDLIKDYENY